MMLAFSRFTRYFGEVARSGSLRRASERLNVSASAIDRQILQAEEKFGLPLFERLPTGLRPTAAGELLLTEIKRWIADYDRLTARMNDLVGLRRGHVRIAVIDALAKGFLASSIRRIREEFAGITFEIRVMDNVDVLASIASGDVDFGILLNPRSSKDIDVRAHCEVVLGFVTTPDHALARQEQCRFNACHGMPMVLPAEPLAIYGQLRALEAASGMQVVPTVSSDSIQMIKTLVREGLGIGVLSSLDVMEEVALGQLAFVRLKDPMLKPLTLALCVRAARQLSGAASLALSRIEAVLTPSSA